MTGMPMVPMIIDHGIQVLDYRLAARLVIPVEGKIDEGEKIIDRIFFWNEIPVIGRLWVNWLVNSLDVISSDLERKLEP